MLIENPSSGQVTPQSESLVLYWVYFAYGIAMLLPWNVFITASDYFSVRFTGSGHETDFMNYFSVFSNLSNLLSLSLFLWLRQKKRMGNVNVYIPLSINLIMFLFYTITSWSPSMDAQIYFRFTVFCMTVAGTTTSLLQLTVFAEASQLSPKYMQAVMSGQGIAGVSVALFSLLTTVFGGDGTIFYFLGAFIVTLISMLGRFYQQQQTNKYQLVENIDLSLNDHPINEPVVTLTTILKQSQRSIFTVVYIYVITLSIFPALTSQFRWTGKTTTKQVFMSLHFLIFNVGDWVGRTLPIWPYFQIKSGPTMVAAMLRTLFVPLFMTLTDGNVGFLVIVFFLAVTNGWLTSVVFMTAPMGYGMESKPVVASVMSYFLVIGLALGGLCSFLY